MGYIVILSVLMIFIVAYLMIGGVSLIKTDDFEQDEIYDSVQSALLK